MKIRSQLFIVLLVTLCSLQSLQANWFRNLIDPHISYWDSVESGSTNLTVSDAIDDVPGYIAAFGDINNDKFTDLFIVYSLYLESDTISVYEWNGDHLGYVEVENSILGNTYVEEILSVIPNDFNYDGYLDVLIHSCDNNTAQLTIYFGDGGNFGEPLVLSPNPSIQQVLLMDVNMDLRGDIFGTDENGVRTYWINGVNNTWTSMTQTAVVDLSPISSPHSNAFVDITGDCLSDLVVFNTNASMELWVNSGTNYVLNLTYPLPVGAGQVSFADFDKDGTMDMVFPVCDPQPFCNTTNQIYVVYNKQTPMCTSITGKGDNCTSPGDICGNNGNFQIPDMNVNSSGDDLVIIPTSMFGDDRFLWKFILTPNSTVPETLRVGDFDMDGYPDLMFQVLSSSGVSNAQLWKNIPCDDTVCTDNAINAGRRYFQNYISGTEALTSINDVFATAFLDIGEDGTLDMVVMTDSLLEKTKSKKTVSAIQNSVDWDGFFFKVLGLNGLCTQWCDTEPKFPDPKPVGVNTPGVVFKYIYTNNDGEKEVAMGNQLTQSAYLSLQTPYVYFGLGSVSNYIQSLYMGVSITGGSRHYSSIENIIPNSQVAGFPSPPTSPRRWKFDILLRPSGMTFWTIVASFITCVILAILTIYFALREKKQDKEERREKAHLFKL